MQPFFELPDLFPGNLAYIRNTEDERRCQGWPEDTTKRLGLYCDESDVPLHMRGDGNCLLRLALALDHLEAVSQVHPLVRFTSTLVHRACCVSPEHLPGAPAG
jgi:hypothetical protein